MSEQTHAPRIYVSGEIVPAGVYRDLESGALVRVYQADELPSNTQIVLSPRLFYRVDVEDETEDRPRETAEALTAR